MYATHQVIWNIYVYTYMPGATIKNWGYKFEGEQGGVWKGLEDRNGGEKLWNYIIISKKWEKGERRNEAKGFEVEIHKHNWYFLF